MKRFAFRHVNAFTSEPFGGNPAGVLLDAKGLTDQQMQSIAREINLSETAFILPAKVKGADLQIRWFTPTVEVPLCGHATIASFHVLAQDGLFGMKEVGTYHFRLQTKSGILRIMVEKKSSGTIIEFQLPVPKFKRVSKLPIKLLSALGIRTADLHPRLPIVGESYLYVPLRRLSRLKELDPDYSRLFDVTISMKVLGVSVFTMEVIESSSAFHSRFFAPAAGINEDPVTGSANGPLGAYVYLHADHTGLAIPSMAMGDGRIEYIGEQGDIIGRKGRVKVRVKPGKRGIGSLLIAGEAVTFYSSALQL